MKKPLETSVYQISSIARGYFEREIGRRKRVQVRERALQQLLGYVRARG